MCEWQLEVWMQGCATDETEKNGRQREEEKKKGKEKREESGDIGRSCFILERHS